MKTENNLSKKYFFVRKYFIIPQGIFCINLKFRQKKIKNKLEGFIYRFKK